uniref:Uncharacterized protein n=1 Tax=Caenorhabditis japonica TaxID=281687 RepID=A0A8R1DLM8_CAEJA
MKKEIKQFDSKLFRSKRKSPMVASPTGMKIPLPFLSVEVCAAIRLFPNGKSAEDDKIAAGFLKSLDNVIL